MLAVPGPMRGSASRKAAIGTTVARPASVMTVAHAGALSAKLERAGRRPAGERRDCRAADDERREQQPVDPLGDAVGEQDVGRVGDDGRRGECEAEPVDAADVRAAEHEHRAGDRGGERNRAAAVRPLAADRDRDGDDDGRVRGEQQRDERGVEPRRAR